ncbi:phage portal protein, HK97 family [Mycobacteroides abscessus subsp. massiliense]|uniref:phage portal protein n=1 Tax=Mycobacteroides abscessus TaxID=36809 RepID=UPI0009A8ED10|nr:phage portal protein [Mycobacteroides abscessus]SKM81124.1 phage portal protein, HK97 family [Mycobacteroides abscessus subsp. massiliense]SKM97589.1 phage portal protein, HK97 family [Mycobacteroides abscessus subsp. massiliense]SKN76533.1 phage portal protein, HK97 family [Mycobacteroides abscessus subsp. massiliense]SKN96682.1 phage portal protein, HK97 family [Mycobacteroides abscessus subsp. massiliense]SKO21128.1 phage portal protein, HK97 family [Mycobacteroides abscessus subsp. mass
MSFLSRAFARPPAAEERVLTSSSFVPSPAEDDAMYPWGSNSYSVTPRGARETQVAAFTACVTLLADTIASLQLVAYKQQGQRRVLLDPQPLFVQQPFVDCTLFEWLWMLMEAMAVTGNAFNLVVSRDSMGYPRGLMPVHPDFVTVTVTDRRSWMEPTYRVDGETIRSGDMVHMKRYPIADAALGMSPVQRAAAAIGIALAAERYGLNYFKDSANPSSVLETSENLDQDQAKHIMQQWIASHQGRRRPAILSGGVKWRPIALSPTESQFLEVRKYQRGEIAMLFRIPPHMIGDVAKTTSWGTGIEQQTLGFVKFTLQPWLTCIEQAFSQMLPRGTFVKFNLDGLLRGDMKSRFEAYKMGREMGAYSVDDIRAFEDLPPVPYGDGRIQPINFGPLGWTPANGQQSGEDPEPTDNEPEDDIPDAEDDVEQEPDEEDNEQ